MTTTINRNQIFTVPDLRAYLEAMGAWECHIYPYGYEDKETSEDPIQQIFGLDETMNWIMENPAYCDWGEMTGYMVVIFNHNRDFVDEVIF